MVVGLVQREKDRLVSNWMTTNGGRAARAG
jgi:hypothetical protein